MRFVGVSIALLLTLITPALAQSAKHQPVFIFGEGLASCGEFLQRLRPSGKRVPRRLQPLRFMTANTLP